MLRSIILMCFALLAVSPAIAQEKKVETRTEIDSVTGQRKVITAETISTTEDITPRQHMLVINPLKFFWMYNLSYYTRIDKSMVVGGGLQMPAISGFNGWGANAEVRFHPSGKAMRGFYVAPNVSYNSLSTDFSDFGGDGSDELTSSAISVGALVGWQWFPGDDFAIGLGIGVDYYFLTADANDSEGNNAFDSYDGTFPALRFDIGYAW